jgi:predicted site-specific integrase-resolvase
MGRHISIQDATKHFNVTEKTIRRWIKSGKLDAEKQGDRWIVFIEGEAVQTEGQSVQTVPFERLLDEKDARIQQLEEQLSRSDAQLTALTEQNAALTKTVDQSQQLLAVQTQTTQQLTDQLDSSRQLIDDMRSRTTVWQRIKAAFA